MTDSFIKAIGSSSRAGHYAVKFYYQIPDGGWDVTKPSWELPAQSWDHMQNIVQAFNCVERAAEMAKVVDQF